MAALRATVTAEPEPLVTLTHLLQLCRDEHAVLWERVNTPTCSTHVAAVLSSLSRLLSTPQPDVLFPRLRRAFAAALEPVDGVPAVVVAHGLAQFIDTAYGHTFAESFRRRSPYQPGVGDPIPLDHPDLPAVTAMPPTSPPWRLANRLDETRRVRLAGEWAAQFRLVFDYSLADTLAGLVTAGTLLATCHPNRTLAEFELPRDEQHQTFPVRPADIDRQRGEIEQLMTRATAAGASIIVLPELCVTEELAEHLRDWVHRPDGPRLLVAGSYHHEGSPRRRRNTALAWVRGCDRPLTHDKHSPADRPVTEDIQPQGWPELRVYVTADGWHLVIAICRDLLNPHAVHALAEAGANLVLVPAMSETLVPFGGPAAHLVGSCQAFVAVANNPADWAEAGDPVTRSPARALFGHPGFGQQTRFVHAPDTDPGVALLTVRSGQLNWLTSANPDGQPPRRVSAHPTWVEQLAHHTRPAKGRLPEQVILRPAAVLVLLTDSPAGPCVLLTERAADLAQYPGQLVFPGGAAEPRDDGPVAAALREAAEEVGLDPRSVEIIGTLPPHALPDSGFLVTPVVAWSAKPAFTASANLAEVATVVTLPLAETGATSPGHDLPPLGRMTATVIELLSACLPHQHGSEDSSS
ncbi:NUDIX domain-containing protein [Amycolatopsis sp. NPDC003865]